MSDRSIRRAEVFVTAEVAGFDFSEDDWDALAKQLSESLGETMFQYARGKATLAMTPPIIQVVTGN